MNSGLTTRGRKRLRLISLLAVGALLMHVATACTEKTNQKEKLVIAALALANSSSSNSSSPLACSAGFCRMFATTAAAGATKNAGIAGLDNNCATDANKPAGGGTYKALVTDGTARRACTTPNCSSGTSEHFDWVLKPSTEYRRKDGTTVIGTTTANGVFTFPLTNSVEIIANLVVTNAIVTGMNADWTSNANDCLNWTTNMHGNSSTVGTWDATNFTFIGGAGTSSCVNTHMLVCVEQ